MALKFSWNWSNFKILGRACSIWMPSSVGLSSNLLLLVVKGPPYLFKLQDPKNVDLPQHVQQLCSKATPKHWIKYYVFFIHIKYFTCVQNTFMYLKYLICIIFYAFFLVQDTNEARNLRKMIRKTNIPHHYG